MGKSEGTKVKEGDYDPCIKFYDGQWSSDFWRWAWPSPFFLSKRIIYVPTGTIKYNFDVDLNNSR